MTMQLGNIDIGDLSPGQRQIADYILKNLRRIPYLSVDEIAAELGTSTATVSRFAKAIGYTSLKDMKTDLRPEEEISPYRKASGRLERERSDDLFESVVRSEITNLETTLAHIDRTAFERAVSILATVRTLLIYGNGPSVGLADLLGFRFNRFGAHVHTLGRDPSTMAEAMVHADKRSAVVAFAFTKERPLLEKVFRLARSRGSVTILVTDLLVSSNAESADVTLFTSRGERDEFHSMVAPVALIDALTLGVFQHRRGDGARRLEELQTIKRELKR